VIARLSDAGLDSIPGAGRRSSTTRSSRISPRTDRLEQWAASDARGPSTGASILRHDDCRSVERAPGRIVAHLLRVRALQEGNGGASRAFNPVGVSSGNTELPATRVREASAGDSPTPVGVPAGAGAVADLLTERSDRPGVVGYDGAKVAR